MTFLLPYNVRCDALHLNCSIMISWNLFFALHNIHTTRRILGDVSRLRLKVEKFLFASFCTHKVSLHTICINIKVSFSVYTSRCDSNLNLTLMSDACWRYFSCNSSFTTDRIAVITINVHINFLCYIMFRFHNKYYKIFL